MPISNADLLDVVRQLAEDENITATVKESGKGALIAGGCAFVGGVIAGPVGLGIGGVIGAVTAAYKGSGKYKSVAYIIMYEMTPQQKEKLASSLQRALANIKIENVMMLMITIASNDSLKTIVIKQMANFFLHDMGMILNQ